MLTGILGFILGAAGITGHWFLTKMRPGPAPAGELLNPEPAAPVSMATSAVDSTAAWKVRCVGDTLLTPMKDDYAAVVVHAVMEGNFYNVRLLSDPSKYLHVHASLLFSKEEVDASRVDKN